MLPARYFAAFRTHAGRVVGLSITTSNFFPCSALVSLFKSPINSSATRPLKKSGRVLLRLNNVTRCPRAIAYSTCSGPVNPVPPRIRMLSGALARPTSRRRVDGVASDDVAPADRIESGPRPNAPPNAADHLRKVRLVDMSASDAERVGVLLFLDRQPGELRDTSERRLRRVQTEPEIFVGESRIEIGRLMPVRIPAVANL